MKTLSPLTLTGFLLVSIAGFSQNETNHWMFGNGAGLDFSTGVPVPESGCMLTDYEGSACISDPITGNLLMYTNGSTVYTANHTAMPNGAGLKGFYSSTQPALIVPQPGSSTRFYIFTADAIENTGTGGYNYSVVDMTLNNGLGDVIPSQKNILLFASSGEQLSAVKHANCADWWIMTKGQGNTVYRAYLLTSTGVSGPVTSTIGISTSAYHFGQAKFSPDGAKYAISTGDPSPPYNALTQLFDFDNASGLLSNSITLVNTTGEVAYGLSFSGDNSKLYANRGWNGTDIHQYDLSSGIPATIIASDTIIGVTASFAQFQLGKDFKIYVPGYVTANLHVINNPNATGAACGFSTGTVPITGLSVWGLCNFPDSYFNQSSDPCSQDTNIPEEAELIPHIPNIITPNGDGVNDVFKIHNLPSASYLDILNRWGNRVFTTENYTNDWSENSSDGVYFYLLQLPDGRKFSGFVQVVTNR